jgi:hypothetical protein
MDDTIKNLKQTVLPQGFFNKARVTDKPAEVYDPMAQAEKYGDIKKADLEAHSVYMRLNNFIIPFKSCSYFKRWHSRNGEKGFAAKMKSLYKENDLGEWQSATSSERDLLDLIECDCFHFNWWLYDRSMVAIKLGTKPPNVSRLVRSLLAKGYLLDWAEDKEKSKKGLKNTDAGKTKLHDTSGLGDMDADNPQYLRVIASQYEIARGESYPKYGIWYRVNPEYGWKGKDSYMWSPPSVGYFKVKDGWKRLKEDIYQQAPGILFGIQAECMHSDTFKHYLTLCDQANRRLNPVTMLEPDEKTAKKAVFEQVQHGCLEDV